MSTITPEQTQAIIQKLDGMILPKGLGDEHSACSIAAINLALSGELTDEIPSCMSPMIGKWIMYVQDAMPDDMRNSARWRKLLPLAAGTGREKEKERGVIIFDWMWETVLPTLQPLADENGFGDVWTCMTTERTLAAAVQAKSRVFSLAWSLPKVAAIEEAGNAASFAGHMTSDAPWAAGETMSVASSVAMATTGAATAAAVAIEEEAYASGATNANTIGHTVWEQFDPCALLEKLINVK
jgi:hypothetical protein